MRPLLAVFQSLGLQPTPPVRRSADEPPSLCTAVRGGIRVVDTPGGASGEVFRSGPMEASDRDAGAKYGGGPG